MVRNLTLRLPDQDIFPSHKSLVVAKDKPVAARQVPCPICGAGVGEWCIVGATGEPSSSFSHRHRRRLALRSARTLDACKPSTPSTGSTPAGGS